MRQSQLFTKTRREAPKDEVAKNAELLIRGGFIFKEMAGVYTLLPLGLRVLKNIENIIRDEMNALGGQEMSLTALQDPEVWNKSGRWTLEGDDIWFKTKLKNNSEVGLGFTHEEPLTRIMTEHISSYRDLPKYAYQFQTKFRNELRQKSGILRGREFLMKDLYSFSKNKEEHEDFYEKTKQAYFNVFNRAGIGEKTFVTFASGGSFSKYSHEFQTLTQNGEDTIFIDEENKIAFNKEVVDEVDFSEFNTRREGLREEKAIEVGNIFSLGTKFSEALGLYFTDEKGEKVPVIMGSYGIGLGRLMGTVVEVLSDDKGIVWPEEVAPFDAHIIEIPSGDPNVKKRAEKLYEELSKTKSVLYDDRDVRAGEKFADADLIGIPYQIIVSERGNADDTMEIKERKSGKTQHLSMNHLLLWKFHDFFS